MRPIVDIITDSYDARPNKYEVRRFIQIVNNKLFDFAVAMEILEQKPRSLFQWMILFVKFAGMDQEDDNG